jgi:hypothetical protein
MEKECLDLLTYYRSWYEKRISNLDTRLELNKDALAQYLDDRSITKLPTPEGTAYFRTTTARVWPENALLVAWAKENLPEAIRTKEEPDKRLIADHVKRTGECPPDYQEVESRKLHFK